MVRPSYVTDLLIGCRYWENWIANTVYHLTKVWTYGKRWTLLLPWDFLNRWRNFHSSVQDLWTDGKLILSNRYINSHKLLEFSQLLSYFSHQQSPAGIVMLVSARKGRESLQDTLGTTGTCSQSQQGQTAVLHIVNQNHIGNWVSCRMFSTYPWKSYKTAQYKSPPLYRGELRLQMSCTRWMMGLWAASRFLWSQPWLYWQCAALLLCWGLAADGVQYPVLQRLNNLNCMSCTEKVFCVQALIVHEKLVVGVHLSVTELLLCQQIADVVDKELVQPFEILFEGVEYIARAGWTPEGK